MSGTAALVFVAVWETVFIYCSVLIDLDHYRGKRSGWAPWIGFLMGFSFVVVSNYMGMANNQLGKAIGLATPVLLLVMKRVLAYQFQKEKKTSWFGRIVSKFLNLIESKLFEKKNKKERQPAGAKPGAKAGNETDVKLGAETDTQEGTKSDTKMGAKVDTQADAKTSVQADTKLGAETSVQAGAEVGAKVDAQLDTQVDAKEDTDVGAETSIQSGATADTQEGAKTPAQVDAQADTEKNTKTKKSTSKKNSKNTKVPAKVKRWARQFRLEKGKLPGRVEIQKKFAEYGKSQCTKYAAQLKEELGDKAS
jgi:hypothetical protein